MPELPEVETMVRGVREHFVGGVLVGVQSCPCDCRPILLEPALDRINERVREQRVTCVERRAKRILIGLASGDLFVIEPRMTGLMLVEDPPDLEHLRIEWRLRQGRKSRSVWFWDRRGLGTVRLLTAEQAATHLGPSRLGPDALEMTFEQWTQALALTQRPIKVAMLDQKLVAGIGNLYASEILHRAGIHPERPAASISKKRVAKLHAATLEVLQEAIRNEGSTLGDGTYRNVLNQDGSYQNMHRVYGKGDENCPTCSRSVIRRIVQAQRSTFFCPKCQR